MVQWFNLCGAFQTWPTITLGSNLTDVACIPWMPPSQELLTVAPQSTQKRIVGSSRINRGSHPHPIVINDIKWSISRFVWMDSFCFFWICQVDWLIEKVDYMLFLSLHILGSNPSLSWLEMHSIRWTHKHEEPWATHEQIEISTLENMISKWFHRSSLKFGLSQLAEWGLKDILEWTPCSCINCLSKVQIHSWLHWKRYSCLKANQNRIHISWPTKIQANTRAQKEHQTTKLWKQPHELFRIFQLPFPKISLVTHWFPAVCWDLHGHIYLGKDLSQTNLSRSLQ